MPDLEKLQHSEPLFVNRCTYTKEALVQFYRRNCPLWKKIVPLAGAVAFLPFSLIYFTLGKPLYGALFLLYALLFLLLYLSRPYLLAKRQLKLAQNVYHTLDCITTSFYEDGILVHDENTGGNLVFEYNQVCAISKFPPLYSLRTTGMCVLLDIDGFQLGTASEFEAFIQQKTQKKLSVKKCQKRCEKASLSDKADHFTTAPRNQENKRLKKAKEILGLGSILLLILAASFSITVGKAQHSLLSADAYEDAGIHTFYPYRVLPTSVKNTSSSSRERRLHPTKTVYMVHYRTTDGSGYHWSEKALSKSSGQQTVKSKQPVELRVLDIPSKNTYITVEPDQTAESYTSELGQRYHVLQTLSVGYLLIFAAVWGINWLRKKRNSGPKRERIHEGF